MNFKKIILFSILLILTIGAVNAAENSTDDITAEIEDISDISDDSIICSEDIDNDLENCDDSNEKSSDETPEIYDVNDSFEKSKPIDDKISEGKVDKSNRSTNHYGYWVNSIDMLNLNLTDLSGHGVSDIFLNFYCYTRYNQSTIESFIENATAENIKIHIWVQIFYKGGKWTKPINNGTINQEFFNEKIEELKIYASTPGIAGINFDYIRFSGSAEYNNSAEQNPGGMEAISEFINQSTTALHEINPDLILSASLMPEIEYLKKWYGDDYDVISEKMDLIVPMIYTANFRQNATWVEKTTQWFVNNSKGAEVWTGLQGYIVDDIDEEYISISPHSQMSIEIKSSLNGGAKGAIVFRFGFCENLDFINLPIDEYEFSTFKNLDYVISCSRSLTTLDHDFTFNSTYDTDYKLGIELRRNNLIIDGNNHIINGSSLARMFYVTGKNITFQNIIFVNGNSNNGGALYLIGNEVKVINCTFIDNDAKIEGGAIFIKAANATVTNSRFINNTAVYNAAVYMNSDNAKLIDSYFENNYANISAGGVGWAKRQNGLIDNCTFVNNSAHNEGGGAIFWNQGPNGKIINSRFENNYGNFNGSAIFWSYGENGVISNCSFINNNASISGGAIFLKGKNITIEYCDFLNNSANYGSTLYLLGSVLINNTLFKDNAAGCGNEIILAGEGKATLNNVTPSDITPVTSIYPKINVSNITYGDSLRITVTVYSFAIPYRVNGGNASVLINNKSYSANVVNGTATIEIPNLNAGLYNGNVVLDCGANYTISKENVDFEVKKQSVEIDAGNKAYIINYGGKYSITLRDINGTLVCSEKVTFTLNGKNIGSAITNAKGIATITLTAKILKAAKTGTKNLVIKLDSANYNAASKSVKITINKEKTKITAKSKTFKKSVKTKKYAISLKNAKGKAMKKVKVTLKVKGKTYKAKTNSKGKATFKITKFTKKGKFTAKITFKGNSYYKSASKKVKITVK